MVILVALTMQSQTHVTCCDVGRVASRSNATEAQTLKRRHFQWLLESGQDEQAARVKERDGDFVGAITLFLQGGLPAKAAQVDCHPTLHCLQLLRPCTFSLCPSTTFAANHVPNHVWRNLLFSIMIIILVFVVVNHH